MVLHCLRTLTVLAIAAGGIFLSAPVIARAASPAPQPLTIAIDENGAHARRLEHYVAGQTIDVDAASAAGVDGVRVSVRSPDGRLLTLPLARGGPGGDFTGSLILPAPGSYEFQLVTTAAGLATPTEPFTIDVEQPDDTAWLVGLAVGGGTFFLLGGAGFVALRRIIPDEAPAEAG
jgi:hypothetical protein